MEELSVEIIARHEIGQNFTLKFHRLCSSYNMTVQSVTKYNTSLFRYKVLQTRVLIETNYRPARTIAHVRALMDERGLIPKDYMSHVRLSAATTTITNFLNVTSCTLIVTNIPEEYTATIYMVKL
jgi:hypothetical protein